MKSRLLKWHRISVVIQWLRLRLTMQAVRVWSLGRELRAHMPHDQKNNNNKETWNRSNTVINSIKTLKTGPHQNIFKKLNKMAQIKSCGDAKESN